METIAIDIDFRQANILLGDAYNTIVERVNQFRVALDKVTHYDAQDGKFEDVVENYNSARERAYAAIARLDDLADELFPLFNPNEQETTK